MYSLEFTNFVCKKIYIEKYEFQKITDKSLWINVTLLTTLCLMHHYFSIYDIVFTPVKIFCKYNYVFRRYFDNENELILRPLYICF